MRGSVDRRNEKVALKNIKNILFVCTGNSCRSIMAEGYLRHRAVEKGLDIEVRSAGTLGIQGLSPAREALKALTSAGIDISDLRSKVLTGDHIEWSDLILVMEPMHKQKIREMVPEAGPKTFYLGEFNPEKGDMVIPDPIGRPYSFYRASFRLIRQCIEGMLEWLEQ
jgi:protein-tyrosine phosphatase